MCASWERIQWQICRLHGGDRPHTRLADCRTPTCSARPCSPGVKAPVRIHCRRRQTIKPNSPTGGLTAFARSSIVRVPGLSSEPARPVHATKARSCTLAAIFLSRVQPPARPSAYSACNCKSSSTSAHTIYSASTLRIRDDGARDRGPRRHPARHDRLETDGRTDCGGRARGGRAEEKWEAAVDVSAWRRPEWWMAGEVASEWKFSAFAMMSCRRNWRGPRPGIVTPSVGTKWNR